MPTAEFLSMKLSIVLLSLSICLHTCGCGTASMTTTHSSSKTEKLCASLKLRGGRNMIDNAACLLPKSPPATTREIQASPPPLSWNDEAHHEERSMGLYNNEFDREVSPISSESTDARPIETSYAKSPPSNLRPASETEESDEVAKEKPPVLQKGDALSERHVVMGVLGSGAFGTVYAAYDDAAGEMVAVKVQRAGRKYSQVSAIHFEPRPLSCPVACSLFCHCSCRLPWTRSASCAAATPRARACCAARRRTSGGRKRTQRRTAEQATRWCGCASTSSTAGRTASRFAPAHLPSSMATSNASRLLRDALIERSDEGRLK